MRCLLFLSALIFLMSENSGNVAAQDINQLHQAAESGDADAQWTLGVAYADGHRMEANNEEALKWFRLAVEQGHANAQYSLGGAYYNGDCTPKNYPEALKWFQRAVEQGHGYAQGSLGFMY